MTDESKATPGADQMREAARSAQETLDLRLSRLPRNDMGNAERLVRRFGEDLIFVRDAGGPVGWFAWTGTHWDRDKGESSSLLKAQDTSRLIRDEAAAAEAAGKLKGESDTEFGKRIEGIFKWATISGNANKISAMLEVAAPQMEKRSEDLDADPNLLNCLNCTLILRPADENGVEQIKHDRLHLITRVAPVNYDVTASCAQFEQWLALMQKAKPVRQLLQRIAGYSLTGSTAAQIVPAFFGTGANGKSTFVNVIRGALGDYSQTLPIASLLENEFERGSEATPDIARLVGVRLATASEPPKGRRISTSKLKLYTGGEKIPARELRRGFFEFLPKFKLILSFNDKPPVPAKDDGTWGRVWLIKWGEKVSDELKEENYHLKLLTELPGILNWMLHGYLDWRSHGFEVPESVKRDTTDWREENDPLAGWMADCLVPKPMTYGKETRADLRASYEAWCQDNGLDPISGRSFGMQLGNKGYEKYHDDGTVYGGERSDGPYIQLKPEWAQRANEWRAKHHRKGKTSGAEGGAAVPAGEAEAAVKHGEGLPDRRG